MKINRVVRSLVVVIAAAASSALADGRANFQKLVAEKGDAIVTLESVFEVKMSYGGQQQESEKKNESTGFIIDDKGTVLSTLSNMDPGAFYAKATDKEDAYTTRIKSLKYIFPDNTEMAASVVLRDSDLDIAVLKPLTPPDKPMKFISLSENSKPEILSQAFVMGRLGRIARRNIVAMTGEIQAIVEKPRTFYIPSGEIGTARTGVPVFDGDGKILGMSSLYIFPGGRDSLGDSDEPYIFIVVPAADLLQVAEQAKDAKPEAAATSDQAKDTTKEAKETPAEEKKEDEKK